MPINSRQKGARCERELAQVLKEVMGWELCRRSQQFCGAGETADLLVPEVPGLFIESKAVEKLSIHPVMERAVQEAGTKLAVVCHKKNRTQWLITLPLASLPRLVEMLSSYTPTAQREGQSEKPIT